MFSSENIAKPIETKFIYDLTNEQLPSYSKQNELLLFLTHFVNKYEFKFNYKPKFIIKNDTKINGFVLSNYQIIPIVEIKYNR